MKFSLENLLCSLLLVLCSLLAHGQKQRYDTIRYARKYYQKRVSVFTAERIQTGKIIVLGNSIAEFGDWKTLLNDSTVVNRGIAADNTFGVLDRLDDVIARRPGKLFIEIGINDISQNIPVVIISNNIYSIIQRVLAGSPATKIYVHSILPTNENVKKEYPDAFGKEEQAKQVNRQLGRNAAKYRYVYIDLNKELRNKHGKLDEKYAEPDGLHLNNAGYAVWVKVLKDRRIL